MNLVGGGGGGRTCSKYTSTINLRQKLLVKLRLPYDKQQEV